MPPIPPPAMRIWWVTKDCSCYSSVVAMTVYPIAVSCPAKSDVSDFARLIAAEVGQGRLRVKSDVSDFARLIAAEVGQGRLRVKAGHPVTPARQEELKPCPKAKSCGYWIARFRGR